MGEVFIFLVEDIEADSWAAEVAVAAETRREGYRRIRDTGLHKKQISNDGQPTRVEPLAVWDVFTQCPMAMLRRRRDDAGWTAWEQVPDGTSLDWRISGRWRS